MDARARLDVLTRRHPALRLPDAAVRSFVHDRGSFLSATIAYYGFFSLFPLLLVAYTVFGYVLQHDPALRNQLLDSAIQQFPVLGTDAATNIEGITGNGFALVFGLVAALWAGLGVVNAMQHAVDVAYALPYQRQAGFVRRRLRSLATLGVLGVAVVTLTVSANVATSIGNSTVGRVALVATSLLVTCAAFTGMYMVVTTGHHQARDVWPGAVFTGVAWVVLQAVGSAYVQHVVKGASATYGVFAVVIGLLAWMHLLGHVVVLGLELNSAHTGRPAPAAPGPGGTEPLDPAVPG